ncbi:MAG: hypothetical protein EP330_27375 [Deltaproteobacteria bacterium]|nr:MAG: hypothetical protein EP330_27375 [Deltaproteobacteria bacterium]
MPILLLVSAFAQTVDLALPEEVAVGEPLTAVITLRNEGDTPLRIPVEWSASSTVSVAHHPPRSRLPKQAHASVATPVDAASLTWAVLEPGAEQVHEHVLAERAVAGTYLVHVALPNQTLTGGAEDQWLPQLAASREVRVDPKLVPVPLGSRVTAARVEAGELVLDVEVTGPADRAVWVPQAYLPACEVVASLGKGQVTGVGVRTGAGGQPPILDEPHLTLLEPGAHQVVTVGCGTLPPRARVVAASVVLALPSPVVPIQPDSAREVLDGTLHVPLWMSETKALR